MLVATVRVSGKPFILWVGLVSVALASAGCSPAVAVDANWLSDRGGVIGADASAAARVTHLAESLIARAGRSGVTVAVLGTREPGAFAWPGGRVFVSRGLVECMTDAELQAALAHELGHLAAHPGARPPAAVVGQADPDECDADRAGLALLVAIGQDPGAMRSMLSKLSLHPAVPEAARRAVALRIAQLSSSN
ncbi:MAG: M48 family metalloprotease [Phycisphaerae bacterium]